MKPTLLAALLVLCPALGLAACSDGADVAADAASVELSALLDPNTAAESDMVAAGVAAPVAQAVVAERPFSNGVAFATFAISNGAESALDTAFIPLPLNGTTEADFELIPGVDADLAHEFVEYRPYSSMAQFDREIGKYVDAEELARLRRYVTLD